MAEIFGTAKVPLASATLTAYNLSSMKIDGAGKNIFSNFSISISITNLPSGMQVTGKEVLLWVLNQCKSGVIILVDL